MPNQQRSLRETIDRIRAMDIDWPEDILDDLQKLNCAWQPIETATRTGSVGIPQFDLWSLDRPNGRRIPDCFWSSEDECFVRRLEFTDNTGRRVTKFETVTLVTHWRPVPCQPKGVI